MQNLSLTLANNLIPALTTVVQFYVQFAAGQSDPFAEAMTKDRLTAIVASRQDQLIQGSNLAKAAEQVFIQFQGASQLVIDNVRFRSSTPSSSFINPF